MTTEAKTKKTYRVKNPNQSPPGGWIWKDCDTGKIITGDSLSLTVGEVTDWLLANGRDAGDVEAEVHERTAKILLSRKKRELVEIHQEGLVTRDLKQYLSGGKALMMSWWENSPISGLIRGEMERGKDVHVSQEEADRRARVCCQGDRGEPCPANVIPSGKSWPHAWTDGRMLDSVAGKKTAHHEELGVCKACSCELRAAVFWKPNILKASMKQANYGNKLPLYCWKLDLDGLVELEGLVKK